MLLFFGFPGWTMLRVYPYYGNGIGFIYVRTHSHGMYLESVTYPPTYVPLWPFNRKEKLHKIRNRRKWHWLCKSTRLLNFVCVESKRNGYSKSRWQQDNYTPRKSNKLSDRREQVTMLSIPMCTTTSDLSFVPGDRKKSGRVAAITNALNMITGVSFLGIPFAFKQSGWAVGLLLLIFIGYLMGK